MRPIAFLILLISVLDQSVSQPLERFHLSQVRLLDSDFKQAQESDLRYILALDMDKLLTPYLEEAGLEPRAERYGNWENTGLDGHIGGHYLSALAMMYAATGDARMKDRMDYYLSELKRAQDGNGDGYLGGVPGSPLLWEEIRKGLIDPGRFSLNKRWVPLYNIHKIYAGLRDAYLYAGSELAREMFLDLTDWMLVTVEDLSDEQVQTMLYSEHGGLNEVFADAYDFTGNEKYLKLARQFSDKEILDPLLQGQDDLDGRHGNTQIPKVVGYKRIADLSDDEQWNSAAHFFWDNVANKRSVSIGGHGYREHFHATDDFSGMLTNKQGPETCNTYNMLKLTGQFFVTDPKADYMDFYERALYNHILSSVEPQRGGFVYYTPMIPGHYRVYSQPANNFWCCVGSGLENHTKYGELIYAHTEDELYVNLFIPSVLSWEEKGIKLTQQTRFPDEESSTLTIQTKNKRVLTLKIRQPKWLAAKMEVKVNGQRIAAQLTTDGYLAISRKWKNGDEVVFSLPMQTAVEQMPDGSHYYAFVHGPIVLAGKTTTDDLDGLYADEQRISDQANGPMYPMLEMPVFVCQPGELQGQITPVGDDLRFVTQNFESPRYEKIELVPFYRLHNSRYMIYWQSETPENWTEIQEAQAEEEARRQALEAATVDIVFPGEQQPESNHFVQSENSNIGTHNGRHWRDARGWFSYEMKNKNGAAEKLSVMYWGADQGRHFTIWANGVQIGEEHLNGSHGTQFFTVDYDLPEEVLNKEPEDITIRFQAKSGSIAGGVFEVRLLTR